MLEKNICGWTLRYANTGLGILDSSLYRFWIRQCSRMVCIQMATDVGIPTDDRSHGSSIIAEPRRPTLGLPTKMQARDRSFHRGSCTLLNTFLDGPRPSAFCDMSFHDVEVSQHDNFTRGLWIFQLVDNLQTVNQGDPPIATWFIPGFSQHKSMNLLNDHILIHALIRDCLASTFVYFPSSESFLITMIFVKFLSAPQDRLFKNKGLP